MKTLRIVLIAALCASASIAQAMGPIRTALAQHKGKIYTGAVSAVAGFTIGYGKCVYDMRQTLENLQQMKIEMEAHMLMLQLATTLPGNSPHQHMNRLKQDLLASKLRCSSISGLREYCEQNKSAASAQTEARILALATSCTRLDKAMENKSPSVQNLQHVMELTAEIADNHTKAMESVSTTKK